MRRTIQGLLVAAALGAASALPAVNALAESRAATSYKTDTLSGTVRTAEGQSVPAARVRLRAIDDSTAKRIGQSGRTALVAQATTSIDGSFLIGVDRVALSRFLAGRTPSEPISIAVESIDSSGHFTVFLRPFRVTNGATGAGYFDGSTSADGSMTASDPASAYQAASAERGQSRSFVDSKGLHLALSLHAEASNAPVRTARELNAAAAVVSSKLVATLGAAQHLVGQGSATSNYGGFSFDFVYTSGSASEVGVAVSSQANSGYSRSGTVSVSSTSEVGFPAWSTPGMHYHRTKFVWGKFLINADSMYFPAYYLAKPYAFAGGTYSSTGTVSGYGYCVSYDKGARFTKTTQRAITWTNGVYVGAPVNFSVSTVTGYSSQAQVNILFSAKRSVCGSNGYAASSGGYIVQVRG